MRLDWSVLYVEWSREMLLEAWIDDPIACCEKCGVVPPSAVVPDRSLQPRDTDAGSAFSLPLPVPQFIVSCFCCANVCLSLVFHLHVLLVIGITLTKIQS